MQATKISIALALVVVLQIVRSAEIFCGVPPDIPFATLDEHYQDFRKTDEFSAGDIVHYTCRFGYTSRGKSNNLECKFLNSEQRAEWEQARFSCIPQSCGDPGFINNGRRIGSLFAFPNSVKYECNEGYKLVGLSSRYCQASGMWSGKLPICEGIKCSKPQNPENGFVTYITLDYGSELEYKCDKGFHLNTKETVFCTSDGKWSNTNVQCIESLCNMPQQPEFGSVRLSSSKILAGTLALFSCDGNRIVEGPTTSKCLETGEWTFPPPKCLEPCKIPYLSNGMIGNYVQYYGRKNFKQVTVGTKVDDDKELILRCADGYEVMGTDKKGESVSCKFGKWSRELQCNPASCRREPPSAPNSQAVALNPEHGGKVLYLCNENYKKIDDETVVCDFGVWKGTSPVCKDTRCYVDDLKFPGFVKSQISFYRHGEVLKIECDSGYRIANPNRPELECEEGTWRGLLPPCAAASCAKPAPEIDHGQAEVHSNVHSSIVRYTCQEPYILSKTSQVQCLFGEWKGQPPKCEDSRCYLKDLQKSAYVNFAATDSVTYSGKNLDVICKEGYSPKSNQPMCINGKWKENYGSPCKENDCEVPWIDHGDIKEFVVGEYYWSWRYFRYIRDEKYIKIPPRTVLEYGSSVITFCDSGYFFQDTLEKKQRITCFKGQWLPHPVCLRAGQKYVPQTTTQKPTLSVVTKESKEVTASTKISQNLLTTTLETSVDETVTPPAENTLTPQKKPSQEECYCEYPINDKNLIAHADEKRLKFHDKVKNGSEVIFRCKHVGFHLLNGVQNMKCEGCRSWHSSEFPTCTEPRKGNAVIIFDNTVNVSIEGNLEARKGQSVKFMCVAVESSFYPHWKIPSENGVTTKRDRMERESFGDVLYISHLVIEHVDIENEGSYGCAVENNSMNTVNLIIDDPNVRCPEFPDVDGMSVTYDMGRRVKSRAIFSCINPTEQISGKNVLICQKNGNWTDVLPRCTETKCSDLKGNDLMSISYTNDRKVGSRATFHCFVPGKRSGVPFADCLENGTWSNPTPTCKTPSCSVEDISSDLPANVVPVMDDTNKTFPYNTTIQLTCDEDMIVQGTPVARCNRNGDWIVENIRCISGCPEFAVDPNSSLIVTPQTEIYKLGSTISFSCPPGMSLSSESQVIMCLKNGWSENILPDCQ